MVLNEDIYRQAQEEMDCMVGFERLPTIEDRDKLPYLECVLKETYRYGATPSARSTFADVCSSHIADKQICMPCSIRSVMSHSMRLKRNVNDDT